MLDSRSLLVICFVYIVLCLCVSHSVGSTQCNPMDYSLPGSSVHEILQARILEWVAISFSKPTAIILKKNLKDAQDGCILSPEKVSTVIL